MKFSAFFPIFMEIFMEIRLLLWKVNLSKSVVKDVGGKHSICTEYLLLVVHVIYSLFVKNERTYKLKFTRIVSNDLRMKY